MAYQKASIVKGTERTNLMHLVVCDWSIESSLFSQSPSFLALYRTLHVFLLEPVAAFLHVHVELSCNCLHVLGKFVLLPEAILRWHKVSAYKMPRHACGHFECLPCLSCMTPAYIGDLGLIFVQLCSHPVCIESLAFITRRGLIEEML